MLLLPTSRWIAAFLFLSLTAPLPATPWAFSPPIKAQLSSKSSGWCRRMGARPSPRHAANRLCAAQATGREGGGGGGGGGGGSGQQQAQVPADGDAKRILFQKLQRFEGGSFYLGVRGKGVGRGGVFTASTEDSAEALNSWLDSRASQGDDAAARYLLSNRDIFYDSVYSAEMASVGAEPVSQGLWLTSTPLPRHILAAMGSMRGEIRPLTPICDSVASLLSAVALIGPLPVVGWSIVHERLDQLGTGSPSSMQLALDIENAMETKPNGGEGGAVLALLETSKGIFLGVSTHSRSPSVLLSQRFKKRPLNFAAALDPPLAAVALSMLGVGTSDVLLDPCCGTGTVLVGAIERGARVVGFDQAYKFASGTRANLDWLGFGNHTGGGVLRWPPSTAADWQCAVANHDARFPPSLEMPGLPTPTVVVTNMPHGRYLQLPYKGYLREIICTLASTAPAARFGFFHAAGDLQDDGPDNLARALDELGFHVWSDLTCKKMCLTLAYGPHHPQNGRGKSPQEQAIP